jgi:broad-specificity NMP kinase
VIIWLNGTFGAGKTTTARQLAGRLANARHFDPELVGYLLMTALAERIRADEVEAKACQWRLDHISDYEKARPWMESAADLVIDATNLPVVDVAEQIAAEAEKRIAEAGQAHA